MSGVSDQPVASYRPIRTRAVVSWVLYDLANTIFSMGVVSMFLPEWVRQTVGKDRADAVVGTVTAISMAIIFVAGPSIGSMTDRARRRLPFLSLSTIACVCLTMLMGHVGWLGTLVAFVLANAFYQAGQQFYDALLPSVSTPTTRGKIGGIGVGVGYVGSYLAVALSLIGPHFGFSLSELFFGVGLLFIVFSVPCFIWVDETENPRPRTVWSWGEFKADLTRTIATLRSTAEYPELRRFLIGRIFYTDPINTVIAVMMLYSLNVVEAGGLSESKAGMAARIVMVGAITFAIVGGFVTGRLVDKFGARRVLKWVLVLWTVTFVLAAMLGLLGLPWKLLYLVSVLAGISLGATWSADRPLMLELTPPARLGEFYGFYGMVGRFAAIVGPAIWALSIKLGQSFGLATLRAQGGGIIVLLGLIGIAALILRPLLNAPEKST